MRLIIRSDAYSASHYVAHYIISECSIVDQQTVELIAVGQINRVAATSVRPFVLGLPTGSSPEQVYRILIEEYKAGNVSFKNVSTFNMVRTRLQYERFWP